MLKDEEVASETSLPGDISLAPERTSALRKCRASKMSKWLPWLIHIVLICSYIFILAALYLKGAFTCSFGFESA